MFLCSARSGCILHLVAAICCSLSIYNCLWQNYSNVNGRAICGWPGGYKFWILIAVVIMRFSELTFVAGFLCMKARKKDYLFGSAIRNKAGKDSDPDSLVELDHGEYIGMKFFLIAASYRHFLKPK